MFLPENVNPGGGHWIPDYQRELVHEQSQTTSDADGHIRSEAGARSSNLHIYGWPYQQGAWCNSRLKYKAFSATRHGRGASTNTVQYLGIAAEETERIKRHTKPGYMLPLVEAGWNEAYCRQLCEENGLLSPIYTTATRGGCWFCHNQGVDQLRFLRKTYPEYWEMMLKWDKDSPVTFKADGHTLHDYEARFRAEDAGLVPTDRNFRWEMIGRKIIKPKAELPGQICFDDLLQLDTPGAVKP